MKLHCKVVPENFLELINVNDEKSPDGNIILKSVRANKNQAIYIRLFKKDLIKAIKKLK